MRSFELPPEAADAGAARRRIVQLISEQSVLGADREEHRATRERLEPAFDPESIDPHREARAAALRRIAGQHVARWLTGRPLRVLPRMRGIADDIFVRLVIGVRDEERARKLAAATYRVLWTPGKRAAVAAWEVRGPLGRGREAAVRAAEGARGTGPRGGDRSAAGG